MATELEPIVGDWYSYRGRDFTVIDVDEDGGFVEIQYANGNVQQVNLNAWYDMDLEPTDEPEDWESSIDDEVEGSDNVVSPRGSRWTKDDDVEKDLDVDEDDDAEDEDEDKDDDWDGEDEEEDELEGEWRDRRSDEDDAWDEH